MDLSQTSWTPRSRYSFIVEHLASLLLLLYPVALLFKGGVNAIFALLLLLAVATWILRPTGLGAQRWRDEWTLYAVSMFSLTGAMVLTQAYHQDFSGHPFDAISRFWLSIPVFLLLQRLHPRVFVLFQYASPVAAIVGLGISQYDGVNRLRLDHMDPIHFGDFELMLGLMSLWSLNWFGRDASLVKLLKIAGGLAGLAASFGSGSRGGWVAIPVFVLMALFFKSPRNSLKWAALTLGGVLLGTTLLYSYSSSFRERIDVLEHDLAQLREGNLDTPSGVRLQIYKAAADVFERNPVFGVGPTGFASEAHSMMESGKLTPFAAAAANAEVHSDILSKSVAMGVFGLASIVSIYLVPLWLFWRAGKITTVKSVRRAAQLGLFFVVGFFLFGLTVELLNLALATAFYSLTVAVLLAVCFNAFHEIPASPKGSGAT